MKYHVELRHKIVAAGVTVSTPAVLDVAGYLADRQRENATDSHVRSGRALVSPRDTIGVNWGKLLRLYLSVSLGQCLSAFCGAKR